MSLSKVERKRIWEKERDSLKERLHAFFNDLGRGGGVVGLTKKRPGERQRGPGKKSINNVTLKKGGKKKNPSKGCTPLRRGEKKGLRFVTA